MAITGTFYFLKKIIKKGVVTKETDRREYDCSKSAAFRSFLDASNIAHKIFFSQTNLKRSSVFK
jgi:hypothetical protein